MPDEFDVRILHQDEPGQPSYWQTFRRHFIGAHAMNQVILTNSHPTGAMTAAERIDALTSQGGIQNCGTAANCQAVCPKEIPLMTSWARAGRAATLRLVRRLFDA